MTKKLPLSQSAQIIDATNAIVGRLSTFVAKQALYGNKIIVLNSEKAVIIGNKQSILEKYSARFARGKGNQKGPYLSKDPEKMLRRAIRGMLPFENAKGREALRNVKCYYSVPKELEAAGKSIFSKERPANSFTLEEISNLI